MAAHPVVGRPGPGTGQAPSRSSSSSNNITWDAGVDEWNVTAARWLSSHGRRQAWDNLATSAVVFDAQGRVLVLQRAAHDSMPLQWEPPGGAVDEGETVLEGCAREVQEESGLAVRRVRSVVADGVEFTNRDGSRRFGKVVFEVEVGAQAEADVDAEAGKHLEEQEEKQKHERRGARPGLRVRTDEREHCDWAWVGEDDVREGKVRGTQGQFAGARTRDILLEAFRLRRERGEAGLPG